MSSELSLVSPKPYHISVQKHRSRGTSVSTDQLLESLREEQFSSNQKAAKEFIEQMLGSKLSSNDLHETLKDGVLLCSLMNRLRPNVIPQISRKDLPFVKMENISNFLNAARQLGLHNSDLFQTVDLFEGKHMERVVATILAIARTVEGKYVRRNSDVSIEPQILDKFKDLNTKESENPHSITASKSGKSSANEELSSNHNNNDNNNNNELTPKSTIKSTELERTLVNIDPNSIIIHHFNDKNSKSTPDLQTSEISTNDIDENNLESNSSTTFQKKRPSLRKSVTMGHLFTKTENKEDDELAESEFAEELAPLPISPAPTKSEKPVSRNSSTRSSRKTHVRYKSDRTSEISPNKNDNRLSNYGDFNRKRESITGTSDLLREKLDLKNGDEEIVASFQLGNCIGKGQFGAVYRALHLGTGQMVAVKRIKLEGKTSNEIEQLMQEVELLKSLFHPSVVKYESFIMTNDHINIILEYVENGSLLHTLKSFGNFPEKLVVSYVVKILEGLVYLHTKQVVHCDLKAANILTTKNGNVKLSDFGVSLNLRMMEYVSTEVIGTPNWMAPEVIELKGASTASDIWSLGCTIIELLTGKPPYSDLIAMTAMFRIVEDDCPPLPEDISHELTDFLRQCFHKNPSMRPTARELFRHIWIKSNWSLKELRSQESLPFLRRITSDNELSETKPSPLSKISNNVIENSKESPIAPIPIAQTVSKETPPTPHSTPTKLIAATPMVPHRFVKNSFGKSVVCKICHKAVKKHAVMCEECNMVCHTKCSPDAPFPCSLQNHMIRYISLGMIDEPLSKFNSISSESDVPTITSPINSLPTTSMPTPPKRHKFIKKIKKEDSVTSQLSITESIDSSASAASSSKPGSPTTADSSWFGNNGNNSRPFSMAVDDKNNNTNGGGKGSGKGKAGKSKKKDGTNNHGKKDDECTIM